MGSGVRPSIHTHEGFLCTTFSTPTTSFRYIQLRSLRYYLPLKFPAFLPISFDKPDTLALYVRTTYIFLTSDVYIFVAKPFSTKLPTHFDLSLHYQQEWPLLYITTRLIRLLNGWNGTNVGAQGQTNEVSWLEMFVQIWAFTTRWPTYGVAIQKL